MTQAAAKLPSPRRVPPRASDRVSKALSPFAVAWYKGWKVSDSVDRGRLVLRFALTRTRELHQSGQRVSPIPHVGKGADDRGVLSHL
jgi:hypothetical protein